MANNNCDDNIMDVHDLDIALAHVSNISSPGLPTNHHLEHKFKASFKVLPFSLTFLIGM
jgi:hypothetical protein